MALTESMADTFKVCSKCQLAKKAFTFRYKLHDAPMAADPILMCDGPEWQLPYVSKRLQELGVPAKRLPTLYFRVESCFSELGFALGCHSEWSIQAGEVHGAMEDFQFDLDQLREESIREVADRES